MTARERAVDRYGNNPVVHTNKHGQVVDKQDVMDWLDEHLDLDPMAMALALRTYLSEWVPK